MGQGPRSRQRRTRRWERGAEARVREVAAPELVLRCVIRAPDTTRYSGHPSSSCFPGHQGPFTCVLRCFQGLWRPVNFS